MCIYLWAFLAVHKLLYSAELQFPYTALFSITVPQPDSAAAKIFQQQCLTHTAQPGLAVTLLPAAVFPCSGEAVLVH